MDHGPSRRVHFGARDGSPPRVGCADQPHPRRFGAGHSDLRIGGEASSSDRVSAVPVNTMTVWPEPALQLAGEAGATSRQGPTSGWRTRLASRRRPSGRWSGVRRSILRNAHEWRADDHTSGCERPRRAVSPSGTRATAEGWGARARTTGRRSSERALGRERVSSEMRRDDVGNPMPSGVGTGAVDLLSGRIHWHSVRHDGVRPRCLLREMPEPPRSHAAIPSGIAAQCIAWSQTGPKHPAFSRRSGRGTPKRFGPPGETSSKAGRRETRGSIGNESIQSPREHRAGAQRQRRAHRNGLLGGRKP
jgi:hypothetical protein